MPCSKWMLKWVIAKNFFQCQSRIPCSVFEAHIPRSELNCVYFFFSSPLNFAQYIFYHKDWLKHTGVLLLSFICLGAGSVCVCVCERERERERVCLTSCLSVKGWGHLLLLQADTYKMQTRCEQTCKNISKTFCNKISKQLFAHFFWVQMGYHNWDNLFFPNK